MAANRFLSFPLNALIMLLAAMFVFIQGYNIGGLVGLGIFIISFSPIYAVLTGSIFSWLLSDNRGVGV
ncbi:hypothetical protein Cylst_0393 [Cylindrospermum stagnale PCC 7417]|uniref:Uncharacterized protein n=1 Tax=Cylindrospermum stagnale PCC 7417 TaxID=56107 RepID=K9WRC3_9NOST|nr:hypothetical protein [Cylindrospermum stagnale]AFZ22743.1 hypothetical protein Cylst_0393 [Cylindrospermum stagnale PCC 7417]